LLRLFCCHLSRGWRWVQLFYICIILLSTMLWLDVQLFCCHHVVLWECGWSCKGYKEPQASANQKTLSIQRSLSPGSNTTKLAVSAVYWLKLAALYDSQAILIEQIPLFFYSVVSSTRRNSKHSVDHNHHCLDWNRIHINYLHEFQSVLLGN